MSGNAREVLSEHELVRGVDLLRLLSTCKKKHQVLPPRLALEIIASAARSLAFLNDLVDDHAPAVGSLRRTLSPTKILISFTGEVKVADVSAPPADRYRLASIALSSPPPKAPAPPMGPPSPAPAERSLTTRLREFLRPRREFWK